MSLSPSHVNQTRKQKVIASCTKVHTYATHYTYKMHTCMLSQFSNWFTRIIESSNCHSPVPNIARRRTEEMEVAKTFLYDIVHRVFLNTQLVNIVYKSIVIACRLQCWKFTAINIIVLGVHSKEGSWRICWIIIQEKVMLKERTLFLVFSWKMYIEFKLSC